MLNILDKLWGEKYRNMKNDTMRTFMKTKKRFGFKSARGAICSGLAIAVFLTLAVPYRALAIQGDSGYDGGISSGENQSPSTSRTSSKIIYGYQEPCFLSGTPVIFDGTVTISKNLRADSRTKTQILTTTYKYALANFNSTSDKLTRTVIFATTITPKGNGQKTESTKLTTATETIKVNGVQYFIPGKSDYVMSKSDLIDNKPAVNYYDGTLRLKKTYHIGKNNSTDTIIVESSGNYSGYDEYWSSAEAQIITQKISRRNPVKKMGDIGTVNIEISNTTKKEMEYY
ncbi:MAG TPA: S-layer homology domain-containing protein, partial [Ruminiclostridium sp.]|nr:S-layer homology domain-containing protein [Ruminiclostridium sp.]